MELKNKKMLQNIFLIFQNIQIHLKYLIMKIIL